MNPTVTRKEIATAAGISVDTVARRERDWGLDSHRARGCKKPIIYFREQASELLLKLRVIYRRL